MQTISIVTSNPGKVRELRAMAMGRLDFVMRDIELPEIQSLDLKEIVTDKLERAYENVKAPVIVDDVSAELDSLNGLPGPFIKFFNQQLGSDALLQLSGGRPGGKVTVRCIAAYYDGTKTILGNGVFEGTIVKPKGKNGFGFDSVIVPDGQTKTMAEMSEEEKMQVSHRGRAFRNLLQQLGAAKD